MSPYALGFALVTWSVVLAVAFQLAAHGKNAEAGDRSAAEWEQPHRVLDRFPDPISRSRWEFDFGHAEDLLRRLRFTADNEIALDEATLILMKRLASWQNAPENPGADPLRVRFLISKSFPDATCARSFSDLFERFSAFAEAEDRVVRSRRPEGLSPYGNLPHEDLLRLQAQYFSPQEIQGLFARRNRLGRSVDDRARLGERENLSDARLDAAGEAHPLGPGDRRGPAKTRPCS